MDNFFRSITVEPSAFFFIIVQEWMKEVNSNLFLQKSCRFDLATEPDLNTKCDDDKRGILFVSEVNSKYGFVVSLLNMILVIFASIWSDEAGRRRRPLIFIPIIGLILNALSGCLNSYFWHWTPFTAVISWAVIQSIGGGLHVMISFCQMYICDASDAENRTMRLGFFMAIRLLGIILGKGGFGFILRSIGFFYFYAICLILSATSLVLGLVFIKDTSVPVEKKIRIWQMFSLKRLLLVDSFKVVFNRKLGTKRAIVLLLILVHVANIFTYSGEMAMLYLYLRYRFKWDERMYSRYLFCKFFASALGVIFCSFVLSKRLKIHDGLVATLASFCDTMAIIAFLYATNTWQLYSVVLLDMFHGVVNTINISFMSKYYNSNELGRLNAVSGVFLLIVPLSFPVYNKIFQNTLDTFPSAYCLLSVVLDVGTFLSYIGCYLLSRKFITEKRVAKEEELVVPLR